MANNTPIHSQVMVKVRLNEPRTKTNATVVGDMVTGVETVNALEISTSAIVALMKPTC